MSWTSIITERQTGPSWCGPRAPELCHCQQHLYSSLPPPVPVLCAWILSCFQRVGCKSSVEKNGVSILNNFFFWRTLQGPSLSKRIKDTQPLPNPSHASWTFIGYLPSQTLIPFPVLHHHLVDTTHPPKRINLFASTITTTTSPSVSLLFRELVVRPRVVFLCAPSAIGCQPSSSPTPTPTPNPPHLKL